VLEGPGGALHGWPGDGLRFRLGSLLSKCWHICCCLSILELIVVEDRLRVSSIRMRCDCEVSGGCVLLLPMIGFVDVLWLDGEEVESLGEVWASSLGDFLEGSWMELAFLLVVCGCSSGGAIEGWSGVGWGAAAGCDGGGGSWGECALVLCVAGCAAGRDVGVVIGSSGLGVAVLSVHPALMRYSASLLCCFFFDSRALE
jgi:hypothetical protein